MMNNRYKNSILLSAIGDSLGWITEFEKSPDGLKNKYGVSEIDKFYDWEKYVGGRFNGYLDKIKVDNNGILINKPNRYSKNYHFRR